MIESTLSGGEQPQLVDTTTPEVQHTPAAPPAAAPTEGEKPEASGPPTPDDIRAAIGPLSSLTDEQLADLESGDPARVAAVLNIPAQKPETTQPTPQEPAPQAQQEPKGEEKDLHRISIKAIADKTQRVKLAEAMDLVRQGTPLEDALLQVLPQLAAKVAPKATEDGQTPPPAAAPAPAPAPYVDPEVEAIEKQISDLEKIRQTAKAEFDYEKSEKTLLEIAELRAELTLARREAAVREQQAQAFEAQESASREKALEQYAELMTDPETGFADYVEAELIIAEKKSDPILSQPDWPEKIAQRVYSRYFEGRGAQPSQPNNPAQQIPPAPAKPGVRFPGSPVGAASSPGALTQEEILDNWSQMTAEQRQEILKAVDAKLERA